MTYERFAKLTGAIGLTQLLIALKNLLLLPIIAKGMGTVEYGLWMNVVVTITLAGSVLSLGMPYSIVRFFSSQKDRMVVSKLFSSTMFLILLVNLVFSSLLLLLSGPISNLLFDGERSLVILLSIILPLHSMILLFLGYFRAYNRIKQYSFFAIFQNYGELALILLFLFLGKGLLEAVYGVLLIRAVILIMLMVLVMRDIGFSTPGLSSIREMLNFGLPTIPSNLGGWIVNSSDKYIITAFLGVLFVGYYAPAYTLGIALNLLIAPIAFMLPPVLSKEYDSGNTERVKVQLGYSLKYYLLFAIPTIIGLSLLARSVLMFLSNQEIADNSHMVVPYILISIFMFGIHTIYSQVIFLVKKTKVTGAIWLIAAAINVVLNIMLIPTYGIMGAAYSTLIAYGFSFCAVFGYSLRCFTFPIDLKFIIKSLFSGAVMALFILRFPQSESFSLILMVLAAGIYMALIILMKGLEKKELRFFWSILSNRMSGNG